MSNDKPLDLGDLSQFDGHTPGPWDCYADLPSTEPNWHIVTTANHMRVIANVHIEPGNATDVANAKLITATPQLLAELRQRRAKDAALIEGLMEKVAMLQREAVLADHRKDPKLARELTALSVDLDDLLVEYLK